MSCPICELDGGFHDDEIHAAKFSLPEHLKIKSDPAHDAAVCSNPNCKGPFTGPGLNGCRNPRHEG